MYSFDEVKEFDPEVAEAITVSYTHLRAHET